jgi:hypothetical protein
LPWLLLLLMLLMLIRVWLLLDVRVGRGWRVGGEGRSHRGGHALGTGVGRRQMPVRARDEREFL